MSLHKKIKAHLAKKHKHHMEESSQPPILETSIRKKGNFDINLITQKLKNPLILVPLVILILSILIAGFLYFNKQNLTLPSLNTIDLTKGKITDLQDNLGFYIEQAPEVCDQNNLTKTFKSFVVPGETGKPTKSGAHSVYGETTWNYMLQGEISKIETMPTGIKYTLISGEDTLITQSTNNTVAWKPEPVKVDVSSFALKDKVRLYYLVKCGENKPPLLFLEYIQKTATTTAKQPAIATSSGGLKTRSNNWQGFRGTVKEKGANSLTLVSEGQTMKIEIGSNVHLRIINESELKKNPELYLKQPPQEASISGVKIGETVDATGEIDGTTFKAKSVIIIR
ncbi:MAG: hypothetical protein PHQ59_00210 [Candidatus Daviesbacteria bacterium]|nr:hypothetical protein [Candidatus Daviesbacteria bacterium]